MKSVRDPRNLPPNRPYSAAVIVGKWVYASGHVPFDKDGGVVGNNASEQTAQVLRNLGYTLESAGVSRRDIVSTTIYLTQISDIDAVDEIYREYFGDQALPARTTVEVSALGRPEFVVEISAVARLGAGSD